MTDTDDLASDLALARSLAAAADETALREHRDGVRTQTKADGTPVTNVDLAVDRVLVDALREARALGDARGARGRRCRGRGCDHPADARSALVGDPRRRRVHRPRCRSRA